MTVWVNRGGVFLELERMWCSPWSLRIHWAAYWLFDWSRCGSCHCEEYYKEWKQNYRRACAGNQKCRNRKFNFFFNYSPFFWFFRKNLHFGEFGVKQRIFTTIHHRCLYLIHLILKPKKLSGIHSKYLHMLGLSSTLSTFYSSQVNSKVLN